MPDTAIALPEPMIGEEGTFLFAGIREFRAFDERAGIPGQWQRFAPHIGSIPGQAGPHTFGVCLAAENAEREGFDYLTAVAVRSLDDLPEGLSGVRLGKRRYARFRHELHVSRIGDTCAAIFADFRVSPATRTAVVWAYPDTWLFTPTAGTVSGLPRSSTARVIVGWASTRNTGNRGSQCRSSCTS